MYLSRKAWRCAGRAFYPEDWWCPERKECRRYMALRHFDKADGIESYDGIEVLVADKECKWKLPA